MTDVTFPDEHLRDDSPGDFSRRVFTSSTILRETSPGECLRHLLFSGRLLPESVYIIDYSPGDFSRRVFTSPTILRETSPGECLRHRLFSGRLLPENTTLADYNLVRGRKGQQQLLPENISGVLIGRRNPRLTRSAETIAVLSNRYCVG